MAQALPHIAVRELAWRLHFMLGALAYTLAGTDAWKLIAALNPAETGNDRLLLRRFAPFLIAGLKAPLPDLARHDPVVAARAPPSGPRTGGDEQAGAFSGRAGKARPARGVNFGRTNP